MAPLSLLIGTRKGLFVLTQGDATGGPHLGSSVTAWSEQRWELHEPQYLGHIAQHVVADPRDQNVVLMASATGHLGPTVYRSRDGAQTWTEARQPPAFRTGESLKRSLTSVFWLTPGHTQQPGTWFAGGSPQGLFRSDDDGDSWSPVDGWNDHPMWTTWCEWPEQNTPDGSMLHSIIIDPRDPQHLYLGLSSGGVFESADGGADWQPLNRGCEAVFLPSPDADYGHDPHCVRMHPADPDVLYQQNHCGIYRLQRPATVWDRIGLNMPPEVGDIGFPIELHPRDPNTAWVFPMDGTDVWPRTSPDGRPAVYRTRDAGVSWQRCDRGLPMRGWFTVKRQAMTTDAGQQIGVYFGTTSGEVWGSADEGDSWQCLASHLPEIYSIECAHLPE
jgi:photosystem II stability/assembly factor-like uncharacterized protein